MAYAAAATIVFFCCTLVDVCKTGGATIQFVVFVNSRFRSQKDYWKTVFSKQRVSMVLTDRRKTAQNLFDSRIDWNILTVSRK